MRLKTYIVNNMAEAMPLIKKELGIDALILNTKKVKTGGFLGLFQKEKLEVIAAVEAKQKQAGAKSQKITKAIENFPVKQEAKRSENPVTNELMNELKSIKKFMVQVIEDDRLPVALKGLNKRLTSQEVHSDILSELYSKLMLKLEKHPEYSEEQIRLLARQEIISLIKRHQPKVEKKNPEIICFVGPTGVGKTTTIAKIAADYMLNKDKKVGLITSDTYRIAAVEQLRTYANILGFPMEVVQSTIDLTNALEKLDTCDIILMDTAGRNYQQKQYIDDLQELLMDKEKVQINLVLSLTAKYSDMKKIIENFKTFGIDELLFTKKDETSTYGSVLNVMYDYSLPVHHLTIGQNVPDDIVKVSPKFIADLLLGEDEHD